MAATVDGLHPPPPPTVAPFSNQVHRTDSTCAKVVGGCLTSPGAGAGLDGVSPFLASPSQLEYLSSPPSLDAAMQLWANGSNKICQKAMSARDKKEGGVWTGVIAQIETQRGGDSFDTKWNISTINYLDT